MVLLASDVFDLSRARWVAQGVSHYAQLVAHLVVCLIGYYAISRCGDLQDLAHHQDAFFVALLALGVVYLAVFGGVRQAVLAAKVAACLFGVSFVYLVPAAGFG